MTDQPCVLIVEDEPLISEMLEEVLAENYTVICAGRADEALAMFISRRVDVVLLDYHLPGGNAPQFANHAHAAEVPLVWMTGSPDAMEALRGRQLILEKPFRIADVSEVLAAARGLRGKRTDAELRRSA